MFESVVCYLDDILFFSTIVESHIEHLSIVLSKLKEAGLKLNKKKCQFCIREVVFLGFIISEKGIGTVHGKTDEIVNWKNIIT